MVAFENYENHQTFSICVWLANDEESMEYWDKAYQLILRGTHQSDLVKEVGLSVEKAARRILADQMEATFGTWNPYATSRYSLWGQLMSGALGEIDWGDVADTVIDE